ncbi:MAG: hypothetical protein HRT57_04315 [Crocinitomicaceae bacterium]|nr:hypothetical protein [Crocinitomicaceae bacterium]
MVPQDLSTLEELSAKYPYTQLFSILYLKALSKAGDPRFEEELSRHSYRISDRVQLYELIQDHSQTESLQIPAERVEEKTEVLETPQEVIIEDKIDSVPTAEIKIEPKTIAEREKETSSEIKPIEEKPIIFAPQLEDTPTEADPISTNSIVEEKSSKEIEIKNEEVEEVQIDPIVTDPIIIRSKDNLDESILHNALAANYHLEDLSDEEEETTVSDRKLTDNLGKPNSKTEERSEATSFTGWLHSNNNYAERDTSDKEAINAVVQDFAKFDPSSELFGEEEKPRTEFFSPAKKAKKSLEESELPVSETLAKIYIMQGNYPQAISAYKQLSLAFPEKKIFFANLIEDLEKKINT